MRVESMKDKYGAAVGNYFHLKNVDFTGIKGNALQANNNLTCLKPYDRDIKIVLDKNYEHHGQATIRYILLFLGISTGEFKRMLGANEFAFADLNEYEWL